MKWMFILLTFLYYLPVYSQNIGIGTTTPVEKLDVNGNVNLQGQLKVNGNAGNKNQVLGKDASNNLAWLNLGSYINFSSFDCGAIAATEGAGNCGTSWTVPAGVTVILIECWGGGGGGCSMSGGGGGGYVAARLNVNPGDVVSITVGAAGNYGTNVTTGIAGGNTSITVGAVTLGAFGGLGGATGDWHGANFSSPVAGGSFTASGITANQYIGFVGNQGVATIIDYRQISSTDFARIFTFGNGGDAGNSPGSGSKGGYLIFSTVSGAVFTTNAQSIAPMPGGGGGADHSYGYMARGGRVVIHW